MKSSPTVSVVMAVYNGEPFLTSAMRSVLAQSWRDFEFIVVDDGSTDETPATLAAFDDPRIRVLTNDGNRGLPVSLNRGLDEARGEFIARIDADDLWDPRKLERQLAFLRKNRGVVLLGTAYLEMDESGDPLDRVVMATDHLSLRWKLPFLCPFCSSTVIWRREPVMREIGGFDPNHAYAQDWDLWLRIARRFQVANLSEVLGRYRIWDQSLTSTHPRADAEVSSIRTDGMREFAVGLPECEVEPILARGHQVFQLLFDHSLPDSLPEVRSAVRDFERLSAEFESRLDLSPSNRRRHRARWRRHVAGRLLRFARVRREGTSGAGTPGELFRLALRVWPSSVASVRSLRYDLSQLPG